VLYFKGTLSSLANVQEQHCTSGHILQMKARRWTQQLPRPHVLGSQGTDAISTQVPRLLTPYRSRMDISA